MVFASLLGKQILELVFLYRVNNLDTCSHTVKQLCSFSLSSRGREGWLPGEEDSDEEKSIFGAAKNGGAKKE